MKETFVKRKFGTDRAALIDAAIDIVESYQARGYRLTLRQLYYQLVTKNTIVNSEKSYKNLGSCISDARLAGLVDWAAIEDRVRVPRKSPEWEDLEELVESALYSYRLPRWRGQANYVELWVEKDALAGVLWPIAEEFHITLMVNRGYSSQSAMYEASKRFLRDGGAPYLLYLGDHDPSGEDMVRDVRDRLEMFGATVNVEKLALTMAQVEEYNPPPNPAKTTDSRAAAYIAEHGASSWEVDALPPEVLVTIIQTRLRALVNRPAMDKVKIQERADKEALLAAVKSITKRRNRKAGE